MKKTLIVIFMSWGLAAMAESAGEVGVQAQTIERQVSKNPCLESKRESEIIVLARRRKLFICEGVTSRAVYSVALGRKGIYKQEEGDKKTPIGRYPVGEARPSERFGIFIPLGYPTPEEVKQGRTGSDIGIHGPDRRFLWAGFMSTWFNWTQGCVAVANDFIMNQVADWLRRFPATEAHIVDESKESPGNPQKQVDF